MEKSATYGPENILHLAFFSPCHFLLKYLDICVLIPNSYKQHIKNETIPAYSPEIISHVIFSFPFYYESKMYAFKIVRLSIYLIVIHKKTFMFY